MDGLLQAGWNGKPGNNYFILDGKSQLLQVSGDTEQKAKDRCNHGSYTMAKPLKKAEIIAQLQVGNSEREGLRMYVCVQHGQPTTLDHVGIHPPGIARLQQLGTQ